MANTNKNNNKEGNKEGNKGKKRSNTRVKRGGLVFSAARTERKFKEGCYGKRLAPKGSVCMTAVLQYLTKEIAEKAGNVARQLKKVRITPRHIMMAVRDDPNFKILMADVVIAESGVLPKMKGMRLPLKNKKMKIAGNAAAAVAVAGVHMENVERFDKDLPTAQDPDYDENMDTDVSIMGDDDCDCD